MANNFGGIIADNHKYFEQAKYEIGSKNIYSVNGNGSNQHIIKDCKTKELIVINGWTLLSINVSYNWADTGIHSIWAIDPEGIRLEATCPQKYKYWFRHASGSTTPWLEGQMTIIENGMNWFNEIVQYKNSDAYKYSHQFDELDWKEIECFSPSTPLSHWDITHYYDRIVTAIDRRKKQLEQIETEYHSVEDDLTDEQKILFFSRLYNQQGLVEKNLYARNFCSNYGYSISSALDKNPEEKAVEYVEGKMRLYFELFYTNKKLRMPDVEEAYLKYKCQLNKLQKDKADKELRDKVSALKREKIESPEQLATFFQSVSEIISEIDEESKSELLKKAMENFAK